MSAEKETKEEEEETSLKVDASIVEKRDIGK